jgi:enoyl-CoA hydratase
MNGLRVHHQGDLAVVTLEHPPLNLFDGEIFQGLEETVAALETKPPRAVLFRAAGKVVDVAVFDGLAPDAAAALWRRLLGLVHRIEALPFPTVFAAHALTLTAAFEIALGCDLLVASRSARFGFPENVVGLTPSMGGTQRLAAGGGVAFACSVVLTGELCDAETLERRGIAHRVWDDEVFEERALELATRLSDGPTLAHAATKEILRAFAEGGVGRADEVTPEISGRLFATEDLKAAVRSFLDDGPGHATFRGT